MQEKKQKNADFIHRIGPLNIKPTVYFAENELLHLQIMSHLKQPKYLYL